MLLLSKMRAEQSKERVRITKPLCFEEGILFRNRKTNNGMGGMDYCKVRNMECIKSIQSIPGYITFKNGLDRFYTQFELYEPIR